MIWKNFWNRQKTAVWIYIHMAKCSLHITIQHSKSMHILQEITETKTQTQPETRHPPKEEKEQTAAAEAALPKQKRKKPKGLLKRIEKISRKKDEYLSLRNELIEKRKQYLALRAAKKSAIKTISQFEDEQKFEKLIQYTLRAQRGKR